MKYGTVKWFNAVRGYGYIRVAFDVEQTDKGLRALNVSIISEGTEE